MDRRNSKDIGEGYEEIAKLLVRIKGGDNEAFQELYDKTWRAVYYMLMQKIGDEDDALAILNETYGEVYLNIHKLENETLFMKWLMRVAYIRCMRFLKAKYRQSKEEPQGDTVGEELEEIDEDFIPEKALMNKETRDILLRAVDELPQTQRETIFMFYYQNLTVEEIADVTSCPQNTVYKRLHDAKKSLKVKLTELISKGVTLYGAGDFNVLRQVFQEDIDAKTAKVYQAAAWVAIAGQGAAAAPVITTATQAAAQSASTAALAAAKTAGTAIANTALIKTVILGVAATTTVATVAVTSRELAKAPVDIEKPAIIQHTDVLSSAPEDTVYLGEGSGATILEEDRANTPTAESSVAESAPIADRTADSREPARPTESQVQGRTQTEGRTDRVHEQPQGGQMRAVNSAYETTRQSSSSESGYASVAEPRLDEIIEPQSLITPEPEPTPEPTAEPIPEPEQVPEEESLPDEEASPPNEEPASTNRPEPEPPKINAPGPPPSPKVEESERSKEGGGSSANTPYHVRKHIEHIYEINSAPAGDAVIDDIAVFSGEMVSRRNDMVTVGKNNFDSERVGVYEIEMLVEKRDGAGTLELYTTIYVVDTIAPVIEVGNSYVTLEEGAAVSQEEILEMAEVSVTDNSGEEVALEVTGFEEIDFEIPGQYSLMLNALDSQGNEAFQKSVIIIVAA